MVVSQIETRFNDWCRHGIEGHVLRTRKGITMADRLNYRVTKAGIVVAAGLMILGMSMSSQAAAGTYRDDATGFCLDSNAQGSVHTQPCNSGNY